MASKKRIEREKNLTFKNGLYYNKEGLVVKADFYNMGVSKYGAMNNYDAEKYIKGL